MSKDTVSAEQFYLDNEYQLSPDARARARAFVFADALSQHNIEALEAKRNELAAWKQSAMAQLVKADKLREVLTEQSKYLGWDMYEAVADYVSALKAELSALRGKETEPKTLGTCKFFSTPHPKIKESPDPLGDCVNWKPVALTAAPRKHTTWTEVKAEMDAPPTRLTNSGENESSLDTLTMSSVAAPSVSLPTPPSTENIWGALSKLESQILRDDSLPPAYRTILAAAWEELRAIQQPVALPTPKIADLLADIEIIIVGLIDHAANQNVVIREAQHLLIRIAAFKGLGASQPVALPTEEEERK